MKALTLWQPWAWAMASGMKLVENRPWGIAGAEQCRWFFGPFAWLVTEMQRLPRPVPCRGYQKLWNLPADINAAVLEQVDRGSTCGER